MNRRTALEASGKDFEIELLPESLMPEQYFDCSASRARPQAVRRLMLAVLTDALQTIERSLNSSGRRSPSCAEVERWLATESSGSPFSFVAICEALKLEPSYLRAGLRRWQQRHGGGRLEPRPAR